MMDQFLSPSDGLIVIADIGAAFLGEAPPYQPLLDKGMAQLFAFEPDTRQVAALTTRLGDRGRVIAGAVGDGAAHTLHICDFGWSSLLEPDPAALAFFNTFPQLARVIATLPVQTRRLDDVGELPEVDFLKMDVQGAELMVLQNGREKLNRCAAIQLEVSFVPIYKNQPPLGALDLELRAQGFIPHRFVDIKRWPIAPAITGGDPRTARHQLLEADMLYVRDMIHYTPDDVQLRKLAAIAHFIYGSPDLAARCLVELEKRGATTANTVLSYLSALGLKR